MLITPEVLPNVKDDGNMLFAKPTTASDATPAPATYHQDFLAGRLAAALKPSYSTCPSLGMVMCRDSAEAEGILGKTGCSDRRDCKQKLMSMHCQHNSC